VTIFIGDVHGKFGAYEKLIKKYPNSIQVGDMGVGFMNFHGDCLANPPYDVMVKTNAQFIRGNHDNPHVCKRHTQWIPDGRVHNDIMFVGGAFSIDWMYRSEGYSWWPDEQLSQEEFNRIIDTYIVAKPRIMVTHDCPTDVVNLIHSHHNDFPETRTQQAFQAMFEVYQPSIWIFGHHHVPFDQVVNGTRFICLPELAIMDL
jgi:predicted phosphodiesterase